MDPLVENRQVVALQVQDASKRKQSTLTIEALREELKEQYRDRVDGVQIGLDGTMRAHMTDFFTYPPPDDQLAPLPARYVYRSISTLPLLTPAYMLDAFLVVFWAFIMLLGVAGKLSSEESKVYFSYLTNWSWTLQALYFCAKAISFIECTGTLRWWVHWTLFWPAIITAWAVFWMVLVVLGVNPELFLDMIKNYGAAVEALGDRAFHVFTAIIITIDGFLSYPELRVQAQQTLSNLVHYVIVQLLVAHGLVFFYMAFNNFSRVYGVGAEWFPLLVVLYEFSVVTAFLIPFSFMTPHVHRYARHTMVLVEHPNHAQKIARRSNIV